MGPLDGVRLQEAVQVLLVTPASSVGVLADRARLGVDDDRVEPVLEMHDQSACLAAVELGGAVVRLGQGEPAASRRDRGLVADLGLDRDDVRQGGSSNREGRMSMCGTSLLTPSTSLYDLNIGGIKPREGSRRRRSGPSHLALDRIGARPRIG